MGGAKFMGRDEGIPYSEGQTAFDCFLLWIFIGIPISILLPLFIFPIINFFVSISIYVLIAVFLFIRYSKLELKGDEKYGLIDKEKPQLIVDS